MRPNLILITIDCLRADHVGALGYHKPTTPRIDELAAKGVVFTQAFAHGPRTPASFPAILTSTYPLMYGGTAALSEERVTLAESLRNAGYFTAAFHSNPYLSRALNYDKGFDVFWDSMSETSLVSRTGRGVRAVFSKSSKLYGILRFFNRLRDVHALRTPFTKGGAIVDRSLDQLADLPQPPFFLWLHFMDAHYPYLPSLEDFSLFCDRPLGKLQHARLLGKMLENPAQVTAEDIDVLQALYDAQIHYIDQQCGHLFDYLMQVGWFDDTVIAITSDHGDEFGEHGDFSHATTVHSRSTARLYDELLHVPLIICPRPCDGSMYQGQVEDLVGLLDLGPTLLDFLDMSPPANWLGESLKGLMCGDRRKDPIHFAEYVLDDDELLPGQSKRDMVAVRTTEWKFIYDGMHGRNQLYDLVADPGETVNLYSREHETAEHFESIVSEHLIDVRSRSSEIQDIEADEAVIDRLRALGYIE